MTYQNTFEKWQNTKELPEDLRLDIDNMAMDEAKKEDAFDKTLSFGTGGMRGEMGAGTNRLNLFTIRKATKGVADYIQTFGQEKANQGVVISFDGRRMSKEFAIETATTLARNGVKAYLYEDSRTTPQLSYSVRIFNTFMGVMITASHNPPEYNGYKVYGEDGAQLNLQAAEEVISYIDKVGDELQLSAGNFDEYVKSGEIQIITTEVDEDYFHELSTIPFDASLFNTTDLQVVFSPLHGISGYTVQQIFERFQFNGMHFVQEQFKPNGEFPTVVSANPEEKSAFEYAIRDGLNIQADLLLAIDPDGDRLGVAVKDENSYQLLTGNQTGAIILYYLLSHMGEYGVLPENGRIIKTIVTSDFGESIANHFGISTENVLTGFKFIGEKIDQYNKSGEYKFLFGYEESYGYLIKDFARDKDANQAILILIEAAAYYKKQGKSLLDVLQVLYKEHGYYKEALVSITKKGIEGAKSIKNALSELRDNPLEKIGELHVTNIQDYLKQTTSYTDGHPSDKISLPKSNVLKYTLEDGSWVCVRPSGTEPKIKYYIGVKSETEEAANEQLEKLKNAMIELMERKLK
ncbi:phospho-sugar mutase [Rummeliibacillus sp. NPDC094406]|uniref:phospho-sugar mutase n=1 Tax=Rummeliibacillus sp. NPDC094406 TaxID=3364511 RepID=UPI0037F7866C